MRPTRQGLIEQQRWPSEPEAPPKPRMRRFAPALRQLCGRRLRPRTAWRYARWILRASGRFDVDPFAIAALIYDHSRCKARFRSRYGVGLAAINYRMHRPHIRRRRYRYWVLEQGSWQPRKLRLPYSFYPGSLRNPRVNIHFAAALLRVFTNQCQSLDRAFGSVPHRSPLSHLVWGDRVADVAYEENVLRARRRLIAYYEKKQRPQCGSYRAMALHSPVDGVPVKVLSGWGEERSGGRRHHKGIDIFSPTGAPVYAVADGVTSFAGVTLKRRRRRRSANMSPRRARWVRRWRMGLAGRFVMLLHAEGLYSAYMHLERYVVKKGQPVKAGQLIGYVGNTGVKVSRPHLHLEMREGLRGHIDPYPLLQACLIPPDATYIGRYRRAKEGLDGYWPVARSAMDDGELLSLHNP